jgi:SSS family solute:Na+ symporter
LLVPFMMMIPGVIAFHLYGPSLSSFDQAYPQLIRDVLPVWMAGFFLAVLLGAVFSSFNSLLNSAATLFTLDIYAPMQKTVMSDADMVKTAKIASIAIALISFAIAPMLYFSPDGLWQVIRVFTGFYNIPTIVIVIVGLFTARVPALGAKIVIVFHITVYALLRFVFDEVITLHFIHQYAILFVIEMGIMLACGALYPRKSPWQFAPNEKVDLTPWRYAQPLAVTLFSCVVALYLLFSPIGLARGESFGAPYYICNAAILASNVIMWLLAGRRAQRNAL